MTLAERAGLYDAIAQERHVRLGYTSTQCHLRVAGDLSTAYSTDDDNDGQWTAMYLASQCFRYAVTGEPEARQNARVAAYALMKLEQVTGVDGFFARSIVPGDECEAKQQGSGEWHLGADGQWCWKGDTSSDEFVGHVFGLGGMRDVVPFVPFVTFVMHLRPPLRPTVAENGAQEPVAAVVQVGHDRISFLTGHLLSVDSSELQDLLVPSKVRDLLKSVPHEFVVASVDR